MRASGRQWSAALVKFVQFVKFVFGKKSEELVAKSITHLVEPCSYSVIIIRTATMPLAMIVYFGDPAIAVASLHAHTANTPHTASVSVLTTARTSPVIVKLFIYSSFSLHTLLGGLIDEKSVSIRGQIICEICVTKIIRVNPCQSVKSVVF